VKPTPESSPPLVSLNTKKCRKKDRKIKRRSPKEKVFVRPVATTAKRKGEKDKSAKKETEDELMVTYVAAAPVADCITLCARVTR
jgi:hypothetical protein